MTRRLLGGLSAWIGVIASVIRRREPVAAAVLGVSLAVAQGAERAEPGPAPAQDKAADAKPAKAEKAERAPRPPFGHVRALAGDEYSRAANARNQADLLRAEHESRYHSGPAYPKNDRACDADFSAVAAAYRDASATYPGTRIDCECRLRLAGAYQYRGDFARALDEAKQAAELFVGTPLAPEAEMAVGMIYLQALHQPRNAESWFRRVQADSGMREPRDPREAADAQGARDAEDAAELQKWQAAAAQALARCREEAGPPPPKQKQAPKQAGENANQRDKGDKGDKGDRGDRGDK